MTYLVPGFLFSSLLFAGLSIIKIIFVNHQDDDDDNDVDEAKQITT